MDDNDYNKQIKERWALQVELLRNIAPLILLYVMQSDEWGLLDDKKRRTRMHLTVLSYTNFSLKLIILFKVNVNDLRIGSFSSSTSLDCNPKILPMS